MSAVKVLRLSVLKALASFAVIFAILMIYAMTPQPARAATTLTATQVQAVVSLLQAFNVDTQTIGTVQSVLNGTAPANTGSAPSSVSGSVGQTRPSMPGVFPTAAVCAAIARNLGQGSSGDDVAKLQAFLQQSGDLTASTTGFFGPVTETALKAWQARMGVVASGDAATTGFGAVGPKTRDALLAHCGDIQNNNQQGQDGITSPTARMGGTLVPGTAGNGSPAPTCTLTADKSTITAGQSVVLTWISVNATYAGSATGQQMAPQGSITITPTETGTYLKRVFGPGGEGECTASVTVTGSTPSSTKPHIVMLPTSVDVASVFSAIGGGMAAVVDGYLSLFGLSLN